MIDHNNFLVWKRERAAEDKEDSYFFGYSTYVRGEKKHLDVFYILEDSMYDLLGVDVYDFVVNHLKDHYDAPVTINCEKGWT